MIVIILIRVNSKNFIKEIMLKVNEEIFKLHLLLTSIILLIILKIIISIIIMNNNNKIHSKKFNRLLICFRKKI
jgi:hypothetical protein